MGLVTMPFIGRLFDFVGTRFVIAAALVVTTAALVGVTLARDVGPAVGSAPPI